MPLQRMDVVADTACPAGYDVIKDRPEIKLVNRIRTRFVKIRLRFSRAPKARGRCHVRAPKACATVFDLEQLIVNLLCDDRRGTKIWRSHQRKFVKKATVRDRREPRGKKGVAF